MRMNWKRLDDITKFRFLRIPQKDGSQQIIYYKKFSNGPPKEFKKAKSLRELIQNDPKEFNAKKISKFKTVTI